MYCDKFSDSAFKRTRFTKNHTHNNHKPATTLLNHQSKPCLLSKEVPRRAKPLNTDPFNPKPQFCPVTMNQIIKVKLSSRAVLTQWPSSRLKCAKLLKSRIKPQRSNPLA